jgi:hypothetical protein
VVLAVSFGDFFSAGAVGADGRDGVGRGAFHGVSVEGLGEVMLMEQCSVVYMEPRISCWLCIRAVPIYRANDISQGLRGCAMDQYRCCAYSGE